MRIGKSVVRQIFLSLFILTCLAALVLAVFIVSFYHLSAEQLKETTDTFLNIYSSELRNNTTKMNRILLDLSTQKEELSKLKSADDTERNLASLQLHRLMVNAMLIEESADIYIIYDIDGDVCLDVTNRGIAFDEKMELRSFAIQTARESSGDEVVWSLEQIAERDYLCCYSISDGRIIGVFASTNKLLERLTPGELKDAAVVLTDAEGEIGSVWGGQAESIEREKFVGELFDRNYYHNSSSILSDKIELHFFANPIGLLNQMNLGLLFMGIFVGVLFCYLLFVLRFTKKNVMEPMQFMVKEMEAIKGGEYDKRIEADFKSKEFLILKSTTNQMVDEIVGLKINDYEKQIQLRNMELRTIRLQLKPHFF